MPFKTLSAFALRDLWPASWGSSGRLVVGLTRDLVGDDGREYPATANLGAGNLPSLGFHWESDIAVTDGRAATAAIANLPTTDTALPPYTSPFRVYVYDEKGIERKCLTAKSFHLRTDLPDVFTWREWVTANQFKEHPRATQIVGDYERIRAMIEERVPAPLASDLGAGMAFADVPPLDPSRPEFVGTNSPLLLTADQRDAAGGTEGDPSASNRFVTSEDTRLQNALKLRGRDITTARPVSGRPYVYDLDTDTFVPGVPAEAAMTITILRDSFASADGTPNAGRKPSHTNSPGTAWQNLKGTWAIQSGRLQPSSTSYIDESLAVIDTGRSDFTVSVVATDYYDGSTLTTRSKAALIFRVEDERNYWALLMDTGAGVTVLYEVTAGTYTPRVTTNAALSSQQQGHLSVIAAGSTITVHLVGQEPQIYTSTAHMTATKVGVAAYKDVGTPGAVPTYSDFVVTPAPVKYASNPVLPRVPGTWNANDFVAPSCPVWDEDNQRYVTLPSGFDGVNWAIGAAYSAGRDYKSWSEDPSNPRLSPTSGDGHFIAGASRPVKVDGIWYMVAYRADPSSNPSADIYNPPFRIIAFSTPNLDDGHTWTRLNGGQPIVSLGLPGSIGHGGHHDIDLRRCTNGVWQIAIAARGDDSTSVIAFCEGESLLTMGAVSQWNVMGIYGPNSAFDLGQPTFDGDDHEVFSVTFQRAHVAGVKRYLCRADTFDGGLTWEHNDMALAKGTAAWESVQAFDYSGAVRVGDKGFALYGGSPVSGGGANLQDDMGVFDFDWPVESQVTPTDPTPGFVTLQDAATITVDMSAGRVFNGLINPIAGNRTLAVTNAVSGNRVVLYVTQDGAGSRTLALSGKVSGSLSTAAGRTDKLIGDLVGAAWHWQIVQNFS